MFVFLVVISTATPLLVCASWLLMLPASPVGIADYMLSILACGLLALPLAGMTRWEFAGGLAKWGSLALLALLAAFQWQRLGLHEGWTRPATPLWATALLGVTLAVGLLWLIHRRPDSPAIDLQMPLSGVRWYVAHGGSSLLTNHHATVPAQRHALDLTVVGRDGRRARGLRPTSLDDYAAFGQVVVSPCVGRVLAVESAQKDQPIGSTDPSHPAGNFVAIGCGGVIVILAHLQAGSLAVAMGQEVRKGQAIGRVGNSGNSSEPHLHVHAVSGESTDLDEMLFRGRAVPLTFDGRFLLRGDAGP